MSKKVNEPTAAVNRLWLKWKLPDTLLKGRDAMIKAGREYLPQEPAEKNAAYDVRLNRTFLFNAYRKAVRSISGQILSKPVTHDTDNESWVNMFADMDMIGTDLQVFAQWLLDAGIGYGLSHFWIDWPDASEEESVAEQRERSFRPYFVFVHPSDVIGWKSEKIGGSLVLTEVRYRETAQVEDGEYDVVDEERVRVLRRDSWQLFKPSGRGKAWVIDSEGKRSINNQTPRELGWFTLYTSKTSLLEADPPLHDLAEKNLEHWQSSSDQRNILKVARIPILFAKGWRSEDDLVVGGNAAIKSSDPEADLKYVENTGAAIGSGVTDLENIKAEMSSLSLSPFVPRTGDVTATASAIDKSEATAPVQQWARALESVLQDAITYIADAFSLPPVQIIVSDELELFNISDTDMDVLLKMQAAGIISKRTVIAEAKRRDLLSEDVEADEELGLADDESDLAPSQDALTSALRMALQAPANEPTDEPTDDAAINE